MRKCAAAGSGDAKATISKFGNSAEQHECIAMHLYEDMPLFLFFDEPSRALKTAVGNIIGLVTTKCPCPSIRPGRVEQEQFSVLISLALLQDSAATAQQTVMTVCCQFPVFHITMSKR